MAPHPALTAGRCAVITGAASGIGRAVALRLAGSGMRVVLADLEGEALDQAAGDAAALARSGADVRAVPTDVSTLDQVIRLKDEAYAAFGEVGLLMNNAGIGGGLGKPWENHDRWREVIGVNLWGVINGVHAFTEAMMAQKTACAIVNTGSKQGITNPPGSAAYNVSKSGVKTLTEQLSYELSKDAPQISVHLLVPGYTFTGIGGNTQAAQKSPGAWSADQVADFMLQGMDKGDFYILCPDNMVTREVDNLRMDWAMDDLIQGRPALSRWRPEFKEAFEAFMTKRPR
jgi:NAD(P)-dependent dehydrogenase (short-subunit alcohol dehydrogenase family)